MTTIFPIQENEHSIAWTLTLTAQACAQWCSRQRCGDRRYGRDLPTGIVQISPGGAMHASHAVFQCYLVGIWQFVAPFKPMSGGRSYCVAEFRECQESRRGKKVQVLGVFCLGKCSKGSLNSKKPWKIGTAVKSCTVYYWILASQNVFSGMHFAAKNHICFWLRHTSHKQSAVLGLVASLKKTPII